MGRSNRFFTATRFVFPEDGSQGIQSALVYVLLFKIGQKISCCLLMNGKGRQTNKLITSGVTYLVMVRSLPHFNDTRPQAHEVRMGYICYTRRKECGLGRGRLASYYKYPYSSSSKFTLYQYRPTFFSTQTYFEQPGSSLCPPTHRPSIASVVFRRVSFDLLCESLLCVRKIDL